MPRANENPEKRLGPVGENPGVQADTEPSDLFEVMIDSWGYEPMHKRGDFITAADTPYDVAWGEQIGAVRRLRVHEAENVRAAGLASATQPVTPSGDVDLDQQKSARDAAGGLQP